MCAVFGFYDYGHMLPHKALLRLVHELSLQAIARGRDATGISYIKDDRIKIFKAPKAANKVRLYFPEGTECVMGHTRCATQGDAGCNRNNHPFSGQAGSTTFSLAHNGVIWNDKMLRQQRALPKTDIETDSYVAVQLLEQSKRLDFQSIADLCEAVEGNFVFTMLDQYNTLWLAKGSNPLCLIEFKDLGLYVYASTSDILQRALKKCHLHRKYQYIQITAGDVLKIGVGEKLARGSFNLSSFGAWDYIGWPGISRGKQQASDYLLELAEICGVERTEVEELVRLGYAESEIEEILESSSPF